MRVGASGKGGELPGAQVTKVTDGDEMVRVLLDGVEIARKNCRGSPAPIEPGEPRDYFSLCHRRASLVDLPAEVWPTSVGRKDTFVPCHIKMAALPYNLAAISA